MKKFEKKNAGSMERLRIRSGIYVSAVTVLVVVLAVLLNLIVRAVPTKYTEFDLSEAGLYTLSDSSKDIAHALDAGCHHLLSGRDGQRGRHHHKAAGPLRLREQPHQVGDERPCRLPDLRRPVRCAVG